MMQRRETLWTIKELGAQVALALSGGYEGQQNGRVREVPDVRTIRYYTMLGLLDRPAEMRGRTALYGRRHFLQLVAIKRLQARGLSLSEVQQRLFGLTDQALEQLADLPSGVASPLPSGVASAPREPTSGISTPRTETFWREIPDVTGDIPPASLSEKAPPALLQGVDLGRGVTLLLEPSRPLGSDDIEALRVVAAPLLHWLERRRLLRPDRERRSS